MMGLLALRSSECGYRRSCRRCGQMQMPLSMGRNNRWVELRDMHKRIKTRQSGASVYLREASLVVTSLVHASELRKVANEDTIYSYLTSTDSSLQYSLESVRYPRPDRA